MNCMSLSYWCWHDHTGFKHSVMITLVLTFWSHILVLTWSHWHLILGHYQTCFHSTSMVTFCFLLKELQQTMMENSYLLQHKLFFCCITSRGHNSWNSTLCTVNLCEQPRVIIRINMWCQLTYFLYITPRKYYL